MIVPVAGEPAWLPLIAALPAWKLPMRPAVVIAPHPDDETLGAGGLIAALRAAGCPVTVVAVTDGENCYAGEDLRAVRPAEQAAALARLGVDAGDIVRLRLPDSGLGQHEEELYERLRMLVPAGAQLVAPWVGDFHPDHEVCGRAAMRVAKEQSLPLHSYFFWTWHRGTPELLAGMPLVRLPLSPELRAAKKEALLCHVSQLQHPSGEPILPENLLEPAWREDEVFFPAWDPTRTSSAFFEAKYQADPDPWKFASSESELARYEAIVALLESVAPGEPGRPGEPGAAIGEGKRFRQAVEPACSVGVLTAKLAAMCQRVTAFDLSPTAVARARERCAGLPHVEVRCASLTDLLPDPSVDLLVLSEIGYYFSLENWTRLQASLVASLAPGCTVLGAHWLGSSADHVISGDEVHGALRANPQLELLQTERRDTFCLDLFRVVPA